MIYDFTHDRTVDKGVARYIAEDLIKKEYPNAIIHKTITEDKLVVDENGELDNVVYITVIGVINSYAAEEISITITTKNWEND